MSGLSNIFIDEFLIKYCDTYCGIYASDNIPSQLLKKARFSIIVNLSKRREKGSHYIAIICFPTYVLYIDSFGVPCYVNTISNFLKSLNRPIKFNLKQIQHNQSTFCGFFTILYVMYHEKPVINIYFGAHNLRQNDQLCIEYIKLLKNKFISK